MLNTIFKYFNTFLHSQDQEALKLEPDLISGSRIIFILIANQLLSPKDKISLLQTNKANYQFFQRKKDYLLLPLLLEAILEGDIPTIKKILEIKPYLLLSEPTSKTIIQSTLTWKRVYAETPFLLALKTGQIKLIEVIAPYLERCESGVERALDLWNHLPPKSLNPIDFDHIIDVLSKDESRYDHYVKMNEATQSLLRTFRLRVLPVQGVDLNNDDDALELLLLALKVFKVRSRSFKIYDQKVTYARYVLGFLQSLMSREDAEQFCKGFYTEINGSKRLEQQIKTLQFAENISFYRSKPDSQDGLGYRFWVPPNRKNRDSTKWGLDRGDTLDNAIQIVENYIHDKANRTLELKNKLEQQVLPLNFP